MLSSNSFFGISDLQAMLDQHNVCVTAVPGTALAELVAATRSYGGSNIRNNTNWDFSYDRVVQATNLKDTVTGTCEHDDTMDSIVAAAVKSLQQQIYFAKTEVRPAVQALVRDVGHAMEEITPASLLGMEIITKSLPPPLTNMALVSQVSKYNEIPYDDPAMRLRMPDLSSTEIVELMKTGTSSLDKDVQDWLAVKGTSFVSTIWSDVFQQKPVEGNRRSPTFTSIVSDPTMGHDSAIAIFLLARNLHGKPLPDVDMPLARYNETLDDYKAHSAAALCRHLNDHDRAVKSGQLIHKSTENNKIVVNKAVYDKYLASGGDNDVLFGNHLSKPYDTVVDNITAKSDQHRQRWNQHCGIVQAAETTQRFTRTKEILMQVFSRQMDNLAKDDVGTMINKTRVVNRFCELADKIRLVEADNLWMLCLRLVCEARFPNTQAERILGGMQYVADKNPNIPPREAATAAIIDYVCWWVAQQFKGTRVQPM